ncbi:hypothetical protein [uncultured Cyclobacterium sp.]|uniref:hypothetical protein n=1 Tax=uncultured Cyclobacterium sp. TaxID=453820 RepID=UPI0030ECA2B2|tara:strand:+ start:106530 stop:106727 length:198 start_codon:yes stop_codon:yes gene_type:complete
MKNKAHYFKALKQSKGRINEIDLGEQIGLEEEETRKILVMLLSENKIKYERQGICSYSPMKHKKA